MKDRLDRRGLLVGAGGLGVATAIGARLASLPQTVEAIVRAQASPAAGTPVAQATPAWTPPPIPQPLPTVGGVPPTVIGAAPAPASPVQSAATPGASPQPMATPAPVVTITLTPDFHFDPAEATIRAGQAVRWVNAGRSPQTVTGDPRLATDSSHALLPSGAQPWDSGVLNAGGAYVHVFDVPGNYAYFSIPQEQAGMVGRLVVQP